MRIFFKTIIDAPSGVIPKKTGIQRRPGFQFKAGMVWLACLMAGLMIPVLAFASAENAVLEPFQAAPDQVLVLYNADWEIDADGSEPGQDSKEVADYYVKMHTDPVSGKKPYVLGLSCKHREQHLNQWIIAEDSQDNKNGVVFAGKGRGPRSDQWPRDSRHVEIVLKPGKKAIDWASVRLWCKSAVSGETKIAAPVITGAPKTVKRKRTYPSVDESTGRCYRFDASKLFSGTVWIVLQANGLDGKKTHELKFQYFDRNEFVFSSRGADGVRDDKHFEEDIAAPVRQFLEDPMRKLPNGQSLKDHILYIVICHGLPFSCEGLFGIERGVTSNPSDHGDLGSLEQRLQTLYYGWESLRPPVVSFFMAGGLDAKDGVQNYIITSALRYPLTGKRVNPYMHPDTYSFLGTDKPASFQLLPDFETTRKFTKRSFFAYAVSRIDGQGPEAAKRQIDYAIYASKYLTPAMTGAFQKTASSGTSARLTLPQRLKKAEQDNVWRNDELKVLGFNAGKTLRAPFLGRMDAIAPEGLTATHHAAEKGGYYPGAIDFKVISNNGWNMHRGAPIWQQVDHGVTVSACGGPAYGGGPHITNATFLDKRILYRYLFRGRDLGECFLLSTIYVNWSTSLLGDPLYHPDLNRTVIDRQPPHVASVKDVTVQLWPALDMYCGKLQIKMDHSAGQPEVALLAVEVREAGGKQQAISRWPIFSVRPSVILRDLKPDTEYTYRPILTDPYGNVLDLADQFGPLSFKTGLGPDGAMKVTNGRERGKGWQIPIKKRNRLKDKGTIEISFFAGDQGMLPGIKSGDFNLSPAKWGKKIQLSMAIGAADRNWFLEPLLEKGESATLIVRWRRFPLTREVLLKATNGSEYSLVADVRTPLQAINFDWQIDISERYGVKITEARIFNDARPASSVACLVDVPAINEDSWREANN